MNKKVKKVRKNKLVGYLLPPELIRQVKLDAVARGEYPSHSAARRLKESFDREPIPPLTS